jgi:hypothetical protein
VGGRDKCHSSGSRATSDGNAGFILKCCVVGAISYIAVVDTDSFLGGYLRVYIDPNGTIIVNSF